MISIRETLETNRAAAEQEQRGKCVQCRHPSRVLVRELCHSCMRENTAYNRGVDACVEVLMTNNCYMLADMLKKKRRPD